MLRQLFNRDNRAHVTRAGIDRARLVESTWPDLVYAIGDVHGCASQLVELEKLIVADAADCSGDKLIVMLGDYVDRGPASAEVLDRLSARPPAGFRRICLMGNHEEMMLDYLRSPKPASPWLQYGGWQTLESYGIAPDQLTGIRPGNVQKLIQSYVPREHFEFLDELPLMLSLPGMVFVHAGVHPRVRLEQQTVEDLLWIREPFLSHDTPMPFRVVHGHTPAAVPETLQHRIGIDTGAFATGVLTAAKLSAGGLLGFLDTRQSQ